MIGFEPTNKYMAYLIFMKEFHVNQPPPCQAACQINWDAIFIFGVKEGESFHTSLKFLICSTRPIILCDIR